MRLGRLFISDDHATQLGRGQPVRHDATQDSCFSFETVSRPRLSPSLARDDQDDPILSRLGLMQKTNERVMRLMLTHAVQIDDAIHLGAPTQ